MKALEEQQIRRDNPHFGPDIRLIEEGPYKAEGKTLFDFTHYRTVGAHGSEHEEAPGRKFDAWATYLWSPSRHEWCLGAN